MSFIARARAAGAVCPPIVIGETATVRSPRSRRAARSIVAPVHGSDSSSDASIGGALPAVAWCQSVLADTSPAVYGWRILAALLVMPKRVTHAMHAKVLVSFRSTRSWWSIDGFLSGPCRDILACTWVPAGLVSSLPHLSPHRELSDDVGVSLIVHQCRRSCVSAREARTSSTSSMRCKVWK